MGIVEEKATHSSYFDSTRCREELMKLRVIFKFVTGYMNDTIRKRLSTKLGFSQSIDVDGTFRFK